MVGLLKRLLGKESIAFQVVLRRIPASPGALWKLATNGYSVYRSGETSFPPVSLNLESTAKCNLKCPMCPRTDYMTRDVGNMDLAFYRRIVAEIDPVFIALAQFGEPFLHPQLEEMVAFAAERGSVTRITTNATAFTARRLKSLIQAGASHFLISLDSCDRETYERIRVGARFDHVMENIRLLLEVARGFGERAPVISFNVTLTRENAGEIPAMIAFCRREFGLSPTFSKSYTYGEAALRESAIHTWPPAHAAIRAGYDLGRELGLPEVCDNLRTLHNDIHHPVRGYRPCFWPYFTTNVTWDGRVYPCCNYFDCQMEMGDLRSQSFREIWSGRAYRQFRRQLLRDREQFPICRACELVDVGINNAIARVERFLPPVRIMAGRRFLPIVRPVGMPPVGSAPS
ncbi:MAG: SPASM domain-containing protein [Magnetococcales bacterium]|nr:SPASM domain-containing protein [Magnetococcales bacterium]